MDQYIDEIRSVAELHGFRNLRTIKMVDKTRYSALVGKTGVKILVDIQSANVWQWFPYKQRLIIQPRKIRQ